MHIHMYELTEQNSEEYSDKIFNILMKPYVTYTNVDQMSLEIVNIGTHGNSHRTHAILVH